MIRLNDLVIPENENILLINNGYDISIISKYYFSNLTFTGILFNIDGALYNMNSNNLQSVHDYYATVIFPSNKLVVIKINQCLLDKTPSQQ